MNNNHDPYFEKGMPANVEAERSILGAVILDNNVVYQAIDLLGSDGSYFYAPYKNGIIYEKMVLLANRESAIDLVTLSEELKKASEFERVGGATYISSLIDGVPRTDTIEHYAKIVKAKSRLRRLITVTNQIQAACFDEEDDPETIVGKAEQLIFELSDEENHDGVQHVATVAAQLADFYELKNSDPSALIGLSTGYQDLDRRLSGIQEGVTILAGRTGHGKTSVALNIACNVAFAGRSVYYCSPESSAKQIVQRVLASQSRIDSTRMREGRMDRGDWSRLCDTLRGLSVTRFVIDDEADVSPETLLNRARQYKMTNGLDLLIVDYIQLMARRLVGTNRFRDLRSAVQHVTSSLVKISRVLNVPIIALAQLGREIDTRPGHRPLLSDLQESSSIEQDGDVIMFLLREEKYEPTPENEGILKIIFGKFRDGSTADDIEMVFLERYTKMESLRRD